MTKNSTIHITVNGKNTPIMPHTNLEQLLAQLNLTQKRVAIEVNQTLVSRTQFAHFVLNEQDTVEIVQAIGGGCN